MRKSKPIMKDLIKKIFLVLVFLGVLSLFFSTLTWPDLLSPRQEITLSQLVEEINQGRIEKIEISGQEISVFYRDGNLARSQKEQDASFSQALLNLGAAPEKIKQIEIGFSGQQGISAWIGPLLISLLPLVLIFLFFTNLFRQARMGAMQAFDFTKARARLFGASGEVKEKTTFQDVAGLKEAKEELKEIVDFLKNPQKFLKMGARIPRGVLLVGPPGCGKTLLARAVASESGVPFFSISGSEFIELFVGVGSGRVRDLFSTAKKTGRSIIFIDELDAIGRVRGAGIGGGHDEREQTLNQILVEMDGFERDDTRIVLAATNRPDVLDPALLRPGRFDRRIVLDLPDIKDREEVLKIHARGKPLAPSVSLREIAERTPGFSGADLANLVNEAAILAARQNQTQIFQTELLESIEKVILGPERKSHILTAKEKEIAAYHEAGHALVSTFLSDAEPIRKISIVARGSVAGYTLKAPTEERNIKTQSEFENKMAALLGGYVAEKLKFGEITTGAGNDLKIASELARKLVKQYGMSKLGPVSFGEKEELIFLGREITEQRNYSERVAAQIDREVSKFIKKAENRAVRILKQKKALLDKIANTLIEKETIEKEEFKRLLKAKKKSPKRQRSKKINRPKKLGKD